MTHTDMNTMLEDFPEKKEWGKEGENLERERVF